jgi:hypothetical protein
VILKTLDLSLLSAFSVGTGSSIEKRLRDLDMARHTDTSVSLQRLAKQRSRVFAITWSAAIQQHHCVEAASLGPFEAVGKGFCLLQRDLKSSASSHRRAAAAGPTGLAGRAIPSGSRSLVRVQVPPPSPEGTLQMCHAKQSPMHANPLNRAM